MKLSRREPITSIGAIEKSLHSQSNSLDQPKIKSIDLGVWGCLCYQLTSPFFTGFVCELKKNYWQSTFNAFIVCTDWSSSIITRYKTYLDSTMGRIPVPRKNCSSFRVLTHLCNSLRATRICLRPSTILKSIKKISQRVPGGRESEINALLF